MSKSKVLSILPILLPTPGGCATYSEGLMKAWASSGSEIVHSVLTEYQGALYSRKYGSYIMAILPKRRVMGKMNFVYSVTSYLLYRLVIFSTLLIFRLRGYTFVHIHSSISTLTDIIIARVFGFNVTVDVRDTYFELRNIMGANKLIGCSIAIQKKARAILPNTDFHSLPIPIDFEELDNFKSSTFLGNECPFALYLGVISKNKGVDKIISAFCDSANSKFQTSKLILAGPLQEPNIIDNLPDRVIYIGLLGRSEAISAISSASLLVVTGGFEGMPRVGVEAIILGTPVILPPGIQELELLYSRSIIKSVTRDCLVACFNSDWDSFRFNSLDISQFELSAVANQTLKLITH